jgi:hypothetical protein
MRILQINAQSLNTSQHLINKYAKQKEAAFILVSEIWRPKDLNELKRFVGNIKPRATGAHGGVAIFRTQGVKMIDRKDLEIPDLEAT